VAHTYRKYADESRTSWGSGDATTTGIAAIAGTLLLAAGAVFSTRRKNATKHAS